jgi:hypothetical protein
MFLNVSHPDQLKTKEAKYAVAAFTHTRKGRRPRRLPRDKRSTLSWTKVTDPDADNLDGDSEHIATQDNDGQNVLTLRSTPDRAIFRTSSPLTVGFSGSRHDPFQAHPIPFDKHIDDAVYFWLRQWMPWCPLETRLRVIATDGVDGFGPYDAGLTSNTMSIALNSPEAFHIILATSQTIRDSMDFLGAPKAFPSKDVLWHKGRGLQTLKERIANSEINEATMITVLNLMTLDLFYLDVEPFNIHLDALRRMLAETPGFENDLRRKIFEGYINTTLFALRALAYQRGQKAPCDPVADQYPPYEYRHAPLPPGFQALLDANEISVRLATVIESMLPLMVVVNDPKGQVDLETIMAARPWCDIDDLLICLENAGKASAEQVVCLSLFCLCVNLMQRFRSSGIFFRMIHELIVAVRAYQPGTEGQHDLWLWAAAVAAGTALHETPLAEQGRAVIDHVVARGEGLLEWSMVEVAVRKFGWLHQRLDIWETQWSISLERRKRFIAEPAGTS